MTKGMLRAQTHEPDPALQVKCILCGAAKTQVCRTVTTGIPRATHKIRIRDFMAGASRIRHYENLAEFAYNQMELKDKISWSNLPESTKQVYIRFVKSTDRVMATLAWRS